MMPRVSQNGSRLLYLGFAFPPGVQALCPGINPAGHALETQMIGELRHYFAVRSTGLLPLVPPKVADADPASGIKHELVLLEKPPELWHRARSLARLKRQYAQWRSAGWEPDLVLVYNLSPVYNQFLLWLRRQRRCPRLVLLLLDSPTLGQQVPRLKRVRQRCKPMFVPDGEMIRQFDACVGLSQATEKYFRPYGVPFLWMPGACSPCRARLNGHDLPENGSIRFGYAGALGPHAGVKRFVEVFLSRALPATLEICGYGKAAPEFAEVARRNPAIKFLGLLTPDECLRFGEACDVLVNPRPATHGNENNFASKLFDYALSGSAILTSRLSGVETVLGPEAYYFEPGQFHSSLIERLSELARTPRAELKRRGAAVQRRILRNFSWSEQGRRLAGFLEQVLAGKCLLAATASALAA